MVLRYPSAIGKVDPRNSYFKKGGRYSKGSKAVSVNRASMKLGKNKMIAFKIFIHATG